MGEPHGNRGPKHATQRAGTPNAQRSPKKNRAFVFPEAIKHNKPCARGRPLSKAVASLDSAVLQLLGVSPDEV